MSGMGGKLTLGIQVTPSRMVFRNRFLALFWLLAACNPKQDERAESAQAADACKYLVLSKVELPKSIAAAENGSNEAQKNLWHYYGCIDKEEAAIWEGRLIQANDADALLYRSSVLHVRASRLGDDDPLKLALMRVTQSLEARRRKARGDGVMRVLINGREVEVRYSSKPDIPAKRIAEEIDRLTKRAR